MGRKNEPHSFLMRALLAAAAGPLSQGSGPFARARHGLVLFVAANVHQRALSAQPPGRKSPRAKSMEVGPHRLRIHGVKPGLFPADVWAIVFPAGTVPERLKGPDC